MKKYRPLDPVVNDEDIAIAFEGTNFDEGADHRKLLEQGVLKSLAGYHSGYTLTNIMHDLGLLTPKGAVSVKGKRLLFKAFYQQRDSG